MSNSLFKNYYEKNSNYLDAGTDLQRGLLALSGLSSVPLGVGEAMFAFICCGFMR